MHAPDGGRGVSRAFVASFVVLAACVAACWPSFAVLLGYWSDTRAMGMTHGWLIVAIVFWLLWKERNVEGGAAPCRTCLAAMVALWIVWLVALRAGLQIVHLVLIPPIAWLAVAGALGRPVARRFAYPLGYLYFAIPLWGNLTEVLQWTTIYAVRFMLRATGVPAYFQGEIVQVPAGQFHIVGGCSGLHYFLVSLAVASLYAHIHRDPPRRHLAIVAIAGVAAILLNWVRVYCVILAGHLTNMQSFLVRVDHYWFGWGLFGIAMALALWVASRVLPAAETEAADRAAAQPVGALRWPAVVGVVGALAAMALSVQAVGRTDRTATAPDVAGPLAQAGVRALPAPGTNDAAQAPGTGAIPWQPRFKGATQEFRGATADDAVRVYVAVYATQRQGAELGYYRNSITGPRLSEVESRHRDGITWVVGQGPDEDRWLVGSVYLVGGRRFAGPTAAQVYYALRSIGGPVPSGVAIVASRCEHDCAGREPAMRAALDQVLAPVSEVLSVRAD